MLKRILFLWAILSAGLISAQSQLAITEVMSSASTNLGAAIVAQNSDWWELTNFGTNTLDLTGYLFNDNAGGLNAADPIALGLMIRPGESVIFAERTSPASTNQTQFRAWWGNQLGTNVQIVFYSGNGLGSGGDGLRLWAPGALGNDDVVDTVDFGVAVRGVSFIYDPTNAVFGAISTNGVGGAFKAETADDVGSPGVTTGPVALAITQHPTNLSVNPGDTATFTVNVRGVPRPKFQWQFDGIDITGARLSTLTVTNVQAGSLGPYRVVVNNGFQALTSSNAILALNATPEPPVVTRVVEDRNAFIGQTVTFHVAASGVPQPTYQWRFNGQTLVGETSTSLTLSGLQSNNAGLYSVVITNSAGALTNEARLVVTPRPRLVITEIMPAQSTNGSFGAHNDWFELTNFDDFTVDLHGYRLDDNSAMLATATTITQKVLIAPNESVVFGENLSPNEFRSWWGPLRTNVQIIRYSGAALSFSSLGDAVVLWNSAALEDADTIAAETFSTATNGVSFGYNPDTGVFGNLSIAGVFGAFVARESGDIGSPGDIRNPPEARITQFIPDSAGYQLTWLGITNRSYTVQYKDDLNVNQWVTYTNAQTISPFVTVSVPRAAGVRQRFYRVCLQP